MSRLSFAVLAISLAAPALGSLSAQGRAPAAPTSPSIPVSAASSLSWRSIGPALMGGRIQDVAVHPTDRSTWYVAAGSGGVWKTTNAGVTFTPIFERETSYSIGTLAIDPRRPETVWVGTGENVSGRHVGWGDGVYRSRDGGRSWQRMGLVNSQHIARISVDPRNSDHVLVASEGPLWSSGGDRGVFRSTDGGATWQNTLVIDENTGVTDLERDPANPDVLYAAAYQRRRHVWGFLAGGPKSGIYKSTDAGVTWRKLATGLPTGDLGKIGLAVTPADPARVYATIEASGDERGFYRSDDRGESWTRMNSYISGGTGPHYYQEIEASPVDADVVYQMDVFINVTRDGGRSFATLETGHDKHSDNHALVIDPANPRHLIVGTDGGLYESFDDGARWRHFPNLPIAQLYKVALNDRAPFYDVMVGAQDLGTLHGPSRTMNLDGVRNQDWYVPLGADGYGVAFEPGDPDMTYMMWQEGNLIRKDRRNEETVGIKPQPILGESPERWNWDSPILVSPHDPARIYFGSQRIWRSDNRGNLWQAISPDLTLGQERYAQRFYGRTWSVDALFDHGAMSKYATTTSISESPITAGILVVGTDDGVVQVTSDAGATWTRAANPPGLPPLSFVNDVEMSLHDARTVFVVADNHKNGDFAPYAYVSNDLGRTWKSIAGDLPRGAIVWTIQQDHLRPELLFVGTESGVFWSANAGTNWSKLASGMPTIPVRDLKIHRRDNDLVAATFGRGVYVLDDYSPLRTIAASPRIAEGLVFPVRDAWWFVPHAVAQAPGRPELGSDDFTTENPAVGALITVHLAQLPSTQQEERRSTERAQRERNVDSPFPGYDRLRAESLERGPQAFVTIRDAAGTVVRVLNLPARTGTHRITWDLRAPSPSPVDMNPPAFRPPWAGEASGPLVAPGRYSATLAIVSAAGVREVGEAQAFDVRAVPNIRGTPDFKAIAEFQQRVAALTLRSNTLNSEIGEAQAALRHARASVVNATRADLTLYARIDSVSASLAALSRRLNGDPARQRLDQPDEPSIGAHLAAAEQFDHRQPPTATQQRGLSIAEVGLQDVARDLQRVLDGDMVRLQAALASAGVPWSAGRGVRP